MKIVQKEIDEGIYPAGTIIPTEAKLQKRFCISRATIRRALSELVHMDYLKRQRSRGTFVTGIKIEESLKDLCSFTEQYVNNGIELVAKIREFQSIESSKYIAELLKINPGEKVYPMLRERIVKGSPVAIEHWYAPMKFFPDLSRNMFEETGLEQS